MERQLSGVDERKERVSDQFDWNLENQTEWMEMNDAELVDHQVEH